MKLINLIEANLSLFVSLISSGATWLITHFYNKNRRKIDTQTRYLEQIDNLNNRVLDLNQKYFVLIEQISQLQVENALLKEQLRQLNVKDVFTT